MQKTETRLGWLILGIAAAVTVYDVFRLSSVVRASHRIQVLAEASREAARGIARNTAGAEALRETAALSSELGRRAAEVRARAVPVARALAGKEQ